MVPGASAECLTYEQQSFLYDWADQQNISNTSLVGLFESLCSKSYTKNETDNVIDNEMEKVDLKLKAVDINNSDVEELVDERMQNYTEMYENAMKLGEVNEMLMAIYNTTNDTGSEETKAYVDDQLSGFSNKISDMEEQLDGLNTSVTNARRFDEYSGAAPAPQGPPIWIYPVLLAAAALFIQYMGWYDFRKLKSTDTGAKPKGAPRQTVSHEGPPDEEEIQDIDDLRRQKLAEIKEHQRAKLYEERMRKEKDPKKLEELQREYERGDSGDKADKGAEGKAGGKKEQRKE